MTRCIIRAALLAALSFFPLHSAPAAGKPASAAATQPAEPAYAVTRTWPIDGDFGWSSVAVDSQRKLLYVARNNQTQVIDIASGKVIGEINHINGAHRIVLVPDCNRGFIGNVKDGSVTVFDLKTRGVLGTLSIAPSMGAMIYDPASKRLLAVCPFTQSIIPFPADIDVKTGKADPPIAMRGKIGTPAADGEGMVYVPEMDSDEIAVLDTRIMKIATTWRLGLRDRPSDISLDPLHSRLFIVCHTRLLVLAAADGHELASFPLPVGMQTTAYFAGQVFIADPEGPLVAIGQSASGQFEIQQTITAARGAKFLAGDAFTGELFVPMAEFLGPKGRRPTPGTFKIVALQKK
jgi:DNA-binding beta-propeller fold protein YncE